MEFADSFDRWKGHGNNEFRENVRKTYEEHKNVRLIIVKTDQVAQVEAGEDASKLRKEFFLREDLAGEVVEIDNDRYVFRFRHS
jgi:hypothetical protein